MKTVKELIKELSELPPDAKCSAYEGEACGISIVWTDTDSTKCFAFIECSEREDTPKKICDTCSSKKYCGSIPIEHDFPNCWNDEKEEDKI